MSDISFKSSASSIVGAAAAPNKSRKKQIIPSTNKKHLSLLNNLTEIKQTKYIQIYINIYIYIIYVYIYLFIYSYTYIFMHLYIFTCIHMHLPIGAIQKAYTQQTLNPKP